MKSDKVTFPHTIYNQMLDHCLHALPFETCGILSGKDQTIHSIWPLKNEWRSATRFFVKKETVKKTFQDIQDQEEKVIGIYHSHPKKHLFLRCMTSPITKSYHIREATHDECLIFIDPVL